MNLPIYPRALLWLSAFFFLSVQSMLSGEIILVEARDVSAAAAAKWKEEKFSGVAVALKDAAEAATYSKAAQAIKDGALDLYWWIEVGRDEQMAQAHPTWMAGLGSHADWQKRFPTFPEPGVNEVAKAYPWVPIVYAEAFEAHLSRVGALLKSVPAGAKGVLLNDLQSGPGSCGCGNLQCRWAVDYHVSSTALKLAGGNAAGRFLTELSKKTSLSLIPVWMTECEESDMPSEKNRGKPSTGLCGSVGCATGACPREFAGQFSELITTHPGPLAILATHTRLQRTRGDLGGGPGWVMNALAYIHKTLASEGAKPIAKERLWAVVENDELARKTAFEAGATMVVVAQFPIEQSYEPRILRLNR